MFQKISLKTILSPLRSVMLIKFVDLVMSHVVVHNVFW